MSKDGTKTFHRVMSSAENPQGNEVIYLDAVVGRDIPFGEMELICKVNFVRLNSDRIEIKYRSAQASSIVIPAIGAHEI